MKRNVCATTLRNVISEVLNLKVAAALMYGALFGREAAFPENDGMTSKEDENSEVNGVAGLGKVVVEESEKGRKELLEEEQDGSDERDAGYVRPGSYEKVFGRI